MHRHGKMLKKLSGATNYSLINPKRKHFLKTFEKTMNRIPINLFLKNETSFLIERNRDFAKITVMDLPHLSKSELTVLYYLLWGMTVSEISTLKKKKAQTISIQKKKLYSKLGVLNDLTLYRDLIIQGRVKIEKNI